MSDRPTTAERYDPTTSLSDLGRDSFERLAEEFAESCRRGDPPSISECERRHPEHAEKIRKLLPTVALMEQLKRGGPRDRSEAPKSEPIPEQLGEFRVLRELGRGGMGVVYEAVQESLGRHVALKVIHNIHLSAKRLQRFQREAQAVARLHHTNIVPIFGVGEHDGLPYYVMQYIDGSGLDALIASWRRDGSPRGSDHWRFVAHVGLQAAEALEHAHAQGILHRDIKPANLLIDGQKTLWITDFGLAKLTGHDDLTASGDVVGTLRYLAPEALKGEADHRGDVYSLGLTLYELLTLNAPFGELSPSELLRHVNDEQPVRPRKLAPTLPRDLETIVLKAIAREPAHRYKTAGDLARDLQRYLEDRPILARRATPIERAWRWGRRNRLAASMIVTAATAVLLASATGWSGYVRTCAALRRSDANVALSLGIFSELFDRLAAHDRIATPPLGETGRRRLPGSPIGDRGPLGPPPDLVDGRPFGPGPDGGPPPFEDGPGFPPGGPGPVLFGPPGSRARGDDTAFLGIVLSFYDKFARQNDSDSNPKLESEAAWAYRKVGALYERLGREDDAEGAYARAIAMFEKLVARDPKVIEYRSRLVQTYDLADPDTADDRSLGRVEARLRRAGILVDQLVAESPQNLWFASTRVRVYVKLGATLRRLGHPDEAAARYREMIAFTGSILDRSPPDVPPWQVDRATAREALGRIELDRGRRDAAREQLDAAADELHSLMAANSPPLSNRLTSLSAAFEALGDSKRAAEVARWAEEDLTRSHRPPANMRDR